MEDMRKNRALLLDRLKDLQRENETQLLKRLNDAWRARNPGAASEVSKIVAPLMRNELYQKTNSDGPDEIWYNDIYDVTVRKHLPDKLCHSAEGIIMLGISSFDGTARHDFRDMMAIKNQLCGSECEALELYPAESRLLDPSNYYSLWCFPGIKRLKIGRDIPQRVWEAHESLSPQRAFPKK